MTPLEIWNQIDRASRLSCCYAAPGEACSGNHPQGTRVVYGFEALSRGVQGALHAIRNKTIDQVMSEISKITISDALVLKSVILETLSSLKLPNA